MTDFETGVLIELAIIAAGVWFTRNPSFDPVITVASDDLSNSLAGVVDGLDEIKDVLDEIRDKINPTT